MNHKNPFLIAIEDEFIKALENDVALPNNFSVELSDGHFVEILRHGVYTDQGKLPLTAMKFMMKIATHRVLVKSELDVASQTEH